MFAGSRELGVLGEKAWTEENVCTGPVRGLVFDFEYSLPGGGIGEIELRWQPRGIGRHESFVLTHFRGISKIRTAHFADANKIWGLY